MINLFILQVLNGFQLGILLFLVAAVFIIYFATRRAKTKAVTADA